MIIICEPLCKRVSHEKVNSGFIYGLSLAFPGELIRLYADATHIEALKKILAHDGVSIKQLEFSAIGVSRKFILLEVVTRYFSFLKIFSEVISFDVDKIFFLSFSPEILYIIKTLKRLKRFSKLKFAFVLHGDFESIANDLSPSTRVVLPRSKIPLSPAVIYGKISRIKISQIPIRIFSKIFQFTGFKRGSLFPLKKIMERNHSSEYRYIALSPHIIKNANKYIDVLKLNFYTVLLPTKFVEYSGFKNNEHVKFAIFGYGNSLVLHNIAHLLSKAALTKPYEIRVIGMDSRGSEGFANVTCVSNGRVLDRGVMEHHALDIDAFLILYDESRYRLSCSGSILESLSMVKPIVHFNNDCINQFNKIEHPIGFCCQSLDDYVDKLADIIENYDKYKPIFDGFRGDILRLREMYSIEKSAPKIRESFSW